MFYLKADGKGGNIFIPIHYFLFPQNLIYSKDTIKFWSYRLSTMLSRVFSFLVSNFIAVYHEFMTQLGSLTLLSRVGWNIFENGSQVIQRKLITIKNYHHSYTISLNN